MITILRWLRFLMTIPQRRATAIRKKRFEEWLELMKPGLIRLYGQRRADEWLRDRVAIGEKYDYGVQAMAAAVHETSVAHYIKAYKDLPVQWPDVFEAAQKGEANVQQNSSGSGNAAIQGQAEKFKESQGDDRPE